MLLALLLALCRDVSRNGGSFHSCTITRSSTLLR